MSEMSNHKERVFDDRGEMLEAGDQALAELIVFSAMEESRLDVSPDLLCPPTDEEIKQVDEIIKRFERDFRPRATGFLFRG